MMGGKTCLVTGGTSGIGAITARDLARQGARVLVVGRNREKLDAIQRRIEGETSGASVETYLADLSSKAQVERLAAEVGDRHPRIDVLINNAGAMFSPRKESVDGIEMTWALNHLGYFRLTNRLLDRLKAAGSARVVNVASDAHRMVRSIDFGDVESKRRYRTFRAYAQSKLANILFTRELARRLEGTGVTANCLHPGFVATEFMTGEGWTFGAFRLLSKAFAIPPERGALTSIYLATSPEVEGRTGGYYSDQKPARPSRAARDDEAAARLWALSEATDRGA